MLGGIQDLLRPVLSRTPDATNASQSALERFYFVVQREHAAQFSVVLGSDADYALPPRPAASELSAWDTC